MTKRQGLSKKVRFEVFKRDKFTCQYCGVTAEKMVLHVDHIIPVADGGKNEILNLVTACRDCNLGKGATLLSDDTAIARQRAMLEDLETKREQIEMLKMWRDELSELDEVTVDFIAAQFSKDGITPSDSGKKDIRSWLKKFTVGEILDAMDTSLDQYLVRNGEGKATMESWAKAFNFTPRIAHNKKHNAGQDQLWKDVYYIRAILKNMFSMRPHELANSKGIIARALEANQPLSILKEIAATAYNYDEWEEKMLDGMRKS
jgi:hypothetical protein